MNEIQSLIESTKYMELSNSDQNAMKMLLENTAQEHERMLNESNVTGDIAQFTPILMPIVREAFPKLQANELLGVQPMATPTGFMYAMVNRYTGDGNVDDTRQGLAVVGFDAKLADIATQVAAGATDIFAIEGKFALVNRADFVGKGGTGSVGGGAATIDLEDVDGNDVTATAIYTNQALFDRVFSKYSGIYSTGDGEKLGKDMREIGFSIERKSIEAVTRALKGRYTVEMFEDLKRQHGLAADEELISLISAEVRAGIDRETIDFVNTKATISPNSSVVNPSGGNAKQGRWDLELYRTQAAKVSKEAALVGVATRRSQANTLLVSPMVAAMLQQAGTFKTATVDSTIDKTAIGGVVGTFDNRFKVIVDQFATEDYCTVLYKGQDRRDAMGVFAPYTPLQFQRVTEFESGQPAIIAKTRYALDTIPDTQSAPAGGDDDPTRGSRYARSFGIDFTDTILG